MHSIISNITYNKNPEKNLWRYISTRYFHYDFEILEFVKK